MTEQRPENPANSTDQPKLLPPPHQPRPPQPSAPHKSRWWIWVVAALLIIIGIIVWQRHGDSSQAKNKADASAVRPITISAAQAKTGDIPIYIDALGTVTPVYTVTVTARVAGEITKVNYREGQMVKKGDSLLEIDPRPYQAAVTQMEGQLAHDQALLNEAKIDFDRYQQAFSRNAIAKQQLDDQEQVVKQDEGTVKNDEGQLANARVNLVYTHITSPIDGRVGLRLVDPGNIVQAGSTTPLVVITQLQPITVIFSVAEDQLSQIQQQLRKGKKLAVDAFDRDQTTKLASGELLTLDNIIDTTTGTLKLKAVFPNKDNALFPSQFVNARLLVDTLHNVTLIPTPAIQRNAQGAFAYVINTTDQTAQIKTVTPGVTNGDVTAVTGINGDVTAVTGINAGDTVATNGFDKLQDGSKISIRQPRNSSNGGADNSGQQGSGQANGNNASSSGGHHGGSQSGSAPGSQNNPAASHGQNSNNNNQNQQNGSNKPGNSNQ